MAVVEQVAAVVSDDALSPFTKPEYEGVMVGRAPPYVMVSEEALTTNTAVPTTVSPPT